IVIDDSRSMELLYKLTIAKTASEFLVGSLDEDDYLCLVAFDSDVRLLLAPMRLGGVYDTATGQTVKERALEVIENLQPSQGTVIGAGLREAYRMMSSLTSFGERQIMLISDGLNYTDDPDDPVQIATNLYEIGITTSVLDVGRGAENGAEAVAAKKLLEDIAAVSGEKPFEAFNSVENLKDVVFPQMNNSATNTKVEENTFVNFVRRFDDSVSGYDAENRYFISGYIYSKAKASATTVMTVDYKTENSSTPIAAPLYSYWRYGNGKVASYSGLNFGNDITVQVNGINSDYFDEIFFGNVFDTLIPKDKYTAPFTVETNVEGKYATFTITPPEIMNGAVATATVTFPDGTKLDPALFTFKTTCYGYDLALPSSGRYQVTLTYSYGGEEYSADASFSLSYLSEYDAFRTYDTSVLYKMVGSQGRVSVDGKLKIENDPKDVTLYTVSLTAPLLILAAVLWVADIVVRKLKWVDVKSFFTVKKKGGGKS
ncbi:MAG: VWA domain-containing protein, partial [Clostridia bacterium]|nr:VWA domain-containing protein [Clostridia bacterium]